MANERVILCGVPDTAGPTRGGPLSLCIGGNVRLNFEHVSRALLGDVPGVFLDLIDLAVYVYCADQAIGRGKPTDRNFGADWRRRLRFNVPVRCPDLWNDPQTGRLLTALLSFLSEDEYTFCFEPFEAPPVSQRYFAYSAHDWAGPVEEVVLFSGGLDSLGGAVREVMTGGRRVVLVQHRGSPKGVPRQEELYRRLTQRAGDAAPELVALTINKDERLSREYTQRSRSFLYASLATSLAVALGLARLRFYENGVTSLNLPPSAQVVGARASRTTHPQALEAMGRLFTHLAGRYFAVENPFQWRTKAEVVRDIAAAGCADLIELTTSCSHLRQTTAEVPHCGRCSQCIDRRFAVLAAGQEEADSGYQIDLLTGERAGGDPRTMVAVYAEAARAVKRMSRPGPFFARYGEAARVLRHVKEDPAVAAQEVFGLYKRHADDVIRVVGEGIVEHRDAIVEHSLPPSCLLRLVYDGRGIPASPTPPPAGRPPLPEYLFRRRDRAWEVRFAGGQDFILLPSRGADYLHQLLAQPDIPISAVRLVFNVVRDERLLAVSAGEPALDRESLVAFRAAYEEFHQDLEEARANHDLKAQEEAQKQIHQLAEQLKHDTGLGGRSRRIGSDKERVRKAVRNAISRVKAEIGQYSRLFEEHLAPPHLVGGHNPCYHPGGRSIRWVTS